MAMLYCTGLYYFLSLFFIVFLHLIDTSLADLGTASSYSPPYSPTTCYGSDPTQFPSSNLFAAAGSGIWDNGASCGRQYLVKCISGSIEDACVLAAGAIQIRIVEFAEKLLSTPSVTGASIVLSGAAFEAIANISASTINIEFQQV